MNSTSFNEVLKPLGFDIDSVPSGLFFTSREYKYVKEELRKLSKKDIAGLIEKERGAAYYRSVLKIYENRKELFYLIKPNALRYCLKSVALRDAGEVMIDLINSGH